MASRAYPKSLLGAIHAGALMQLEDASQQREGVLAPSRQTGCRPQKAQQELTLCPVRVMTLRSWISFGRERDSLRLIG